jgi:hypothetical protein
MARMSIGLLTAAGAALTGAAGVIHGAPALVALAKGSAVAGVAAYLAAPAEESETARRGEFLSRVAPSSPEPAPCAEHGLHTARGYPGRKYKRCHGDPRNAYA